MNYLVSHLQIFGQWATHSDTTLDRGRSEVSFPHLPPGGGLVWIEFHCIYRIEKKWKRIDRQAVSITQIISFQDSNSLLACWLKPSWLMSSQRCFSNVLWVGGVYRGGLIYLSRVSPIFWTTKKVAERYCVSVHFIVGMMDPQSSPAKWKK